MGGISTGVGLFSGIDTASLINQLLAIEARPRTLVQQRIIELQTQQAGYLSVNSALGGLRSAADQFLNAANVFDANRAVSSNDTVLSASASSNAATGSYQFIVERLVTTQQRLSRGFADSDTSGVGASEFTFELGAGGVSSETSLAELNGGAGIERGKILITDRSGASATVDLSTAVTVQDVLDRINSAGGVGVSASINGDAIEITDATGGAGALKVENEFGSSTATTLGIETDAAGVLADSFTGTSVRFVTGATALNLFGDGNGVNIADGATDFTITTSDGTDIDVDLGQVREQYFTEDWEGFSEGDAVPSTPPDNLDEAPTDFRVVQPRATTLQDVIDAIDAAATALGKDVTAGISGDGTSLVVNDNTGGGGNLIIASATGRSTAEDLGIATDPAGVAATTYTGRRLLSGLNSVLNANLNGGAGLTETTLTFTDRAANAWTFDLTADEIAGSLSDVVDRINTELSANGVGVSVGLNRAGNGLSLTDTSGGSGNLIVSGAAASELGIETAGVASSTLDGANLQKKWIGLGTSVDELNTGLGIGTGEIRITDSSGGTHLFEVNSDIKSVADLLSQINSRPNIDITASLNATGDGISITDDAGGAGSLRIEDVSGSVMRSLNLAGEFEDEGSGIVADGSYERKVTFDANDTLQDIADKINSDGVGVTATIINDGGGANPYRLSFTSRFSGSAGRALIDTGDLDFSLSTLSKGDDAIAYFGSDDPAKAVLLTSSTNTLDDVIQGVTIDLNATSTEAVELNVSTDTAGIETAVQELVDSYNGVLAAIDAQTFFDAETERRGPLLGDGTLANIRNSLFRTIQSSPVGVEGEFEFLFQVGVQIGDGAQLEFDRDRFRLALEDDFEGVRDLFSASRRAPNEPIELAPGITTPNTEESFSESGLAQQIKLFADGLTNSIDGLLTVRDRSIDTLIETQERRIEAIDGQLDRRRSRLEAQFLAMEQAIASLSTQQSALAGLQSLG